MRPVFCFLLYIRLVSLLHLKAISLHLIKVLILELLDEELGALLKLFRLDSLCVTDLDVVLADPLLGLPSSPVEVGLVLEGGRVIWSKRNGQL